MTSNNKENLNQGFQVEIDHKLVAPEAIFIDLDGTLLDTPLKKISKKNVNAIKKQSQFCPIIISTGRSYNKKVKHLMELLDVQYAICQNGAIIANREGKIFKNIILSKEQVNKIVDLARIDHLGFTINSEFLIYTNRLLWLSLTFWWKKRWKRIKHFDVNKYQVNKIVVVGYIRKKKISNLALKISSILKEASVKTSGNDKIVEITNLEATKGKAAKYIANILNIDIKKCVHIGDSENDSTTLNKVGALICMSDGSQKLLKIATHIGPKHKRGGIAKLFSGEIKINQ